MTRQTLEWYEWVLGLTFLAEPFIYVWAMLTTSGSAQILFICLSPIFYAMLAKLGIFDAWFKLLKWKVVNPVKRLVVS